jgi:hypothetical protein
MYSQIAVVAVLPDRREECSARRHPDVAACLRDEPGTLDVRVLEDETNAKRFDDVEICADEAARAADRAPGSAQEGNGPRFREMMAGGRGKGLHGLAREGFADAGDTVTLMLLLPVARQHTRTRG